MSSGSCAPTTSLSSPPKQKPSQEIKHESLNKLGSFGVVNSSADNGAATISTKIAAEKDKTSVLSSVSVKNGLVFRNENLISGTLDALIEHMVPSDEYYPEGTFVFSFLLSARLFIKPYELLAKISAIWEDQVQQKIIQSLEVVDETYSSSHQTSVLSETMCENAKPQTFQFSDEKTHQKAKKSAQNCIQLLTEWIDIFPYDFRDERLMQHVRVLARKCVYIDNSLGKMVSSTLQKLVQRLTILEKYEEFLQTLTVSLCNEQQVNEALSTSHQKSNCSSVDFYTNAASSSSHTRDDMNTTTTTGEALNINTQTTCSSSILVGIGISSHKSQSSSYTTPLPGSYHQHKIGDHHLNHHVGHQQQNNSHQSDSSLNSVNILSPGTVTTANGNVSDYGLSAVSSDSVINNGAELTSICDLCPNAALLAHQLTHIELERLSYIGPEEFVQAFAKENHLESFNDMKKTRNLESYVQWFNRLSYFAATEIVKHPKKKQRVRVIEFWIETARECFNIGNFNSLMAIIAGLNLSPISRLKKTWSKIQSAKFSVLEHQMDPTSNFNSYRSTLKAAMWRAEGATNETERIIIPFFSLLVKDLYFLNEGCSNRLPNGHINFEKFWQLAKQVLEFNTWKKVTCPFEKLPKVIMFLQMSTILDENTLSMASFECEPPENTQEKGRYKTLKSETKQNQQL